MSVGSSHLEFLEADILKLVHGVVLATSLESPLTREVLLVIVPDVSAGHVLVLHTVEALSDLLPLHLLHVGEHCVLAEVSKEGDCYVVCVGEDSPLGQQVGGEGRGMVGRECYQVMENSRHLRSFRLESFYLEVRGQTEWSEIVLCRHEELSLISRHVFTSCHHLVQRLLTEVQCPVEGGAVVVNKFCRGNLDLTQLAII